MVLAEDTAFFGKYFNFYENKATNEQILDYVLDLFEALYTLYHDSRWILSEFESCLSLTRSFVWLYNWCLRKYDV